MTNRHHHSLDDLDILVPPSPVCSATGYDEHAEDVIPIFLDPSISYTSIGTAASHTSSAAASINFEVSESVHPTLSTRTLAPNSYSSNTTSLEIDSPPVHLASSPTLDPANPGADVSEGTPSPIDSGPSWISWRRLSSSSYSSTSSKPSRTHSLYSQDHDTGLAVSSSSHKSLPIHRGPQSIHSSPSTTSVSRQSHIYRTLSPHSKYPFLPTSLSWLHDMTIDILIDQEGHRSALSTFRPSGFCANASRPLEPSESDMSASIVYFTPLKRRVFPFHHAPLDASPILRRISTNSDSRDYISRHANISVKCIGVYTVKGVEISTLPFLNSRKDPTKLSWKFDYVVDERRTNTGRVVEGERTIMPLSFSCSSYLLHPLQGKKVTLMHVVKKSVLARIAAEKVEPPKPVDTTEPSDPASVVRTDSSPESPSEAKTDSSAHRRAQSHGVPEGTSLADKENIDHDNSTIQKRRRRASSAGERASGPVKSPFSALQVSSPSINSAKEAGLPRNILRRSQIAAIMDQMETKAEVPWKTEYTGLSPCPLQLRQYAM